MSAASSAAEAALSDNKADNQPAREETEGQSFVSHVRGLWGSISSAVRQLVLLEDRLNGLVKEDERTRALTDQLRETVARLVALISEMDRRTAERFTELDKRLAETDRRTQAEIKLAIREELDRRESRSARR